MARSIFLSWSGSQALALQKPRMWKLSGLVTVYSEPLPNWVTIWSRFAATRSVPSEHLVFGSEGIGSSLEANPGLTQKASGTENANFTGMGGSVLSSDSFSETGDAVLSSFWSAARQ